MSLPNRTMPRALTCGTPAAWGIAIRRLISAVGLATFMAGSVAGITISAAPGPFGGSRVSTPWGEFLVVQEGSTVWVGTEAEYVHARATEMFRRDGLVEMPMQGRPSSEHYFVSSVLPSVQVGRLRIANIEVLVGFDLLPDKGMNRPKKSKDSEYVAVIWVQNGKPTTDAAIYDSESVKTFQPFTCWTSEDIRQCQFAVPRTSLAHPGLLIFSAQGIRPGAIALRSVAQANYTAILAGMKMLRESTPSEEDAKTLRRLHQLDPAVPVDAAAEK